MSATPPRSVRWLQRRLPGADRSQRRYRKLVKRFLVGAHAESAQMMDDEAFTLEWPDGTRFSLHSSPDRVPTEVGALDESPSLGERPARMPDRSEVAPAFVPGEEVACDRCEQRFRQGERGSRTHVATYPGHGGGVDFALHEGPSCAAKLTDEESAAQARVFLDSVVAQVTDLARLNRWAQHLS